MAGGGGVEIFLHVQSTTDSGYKKIELGLNPRLHVIELKSVKTGI